MEEKQKMKSTSPINCKVILVGDTGVGKTCIIHRYLDKYNPNETILFYIFYIFISCPIQEFLYRGVFGYFDMNSKYNYLWLILSSLCYSFVHIIYKDILTCVLTFIIGIIWYILYKKDKNLCGVTISHMVLGVATIVLGIIN